MITYRTNVRSPGEAKHLNLCQVSYKIFRDGWRWTRLPLG
jgi:hypothetical protein